MSELTHNSDYIDELDSWFNEPEESTIEIINSNHCTNKYNNYDNDTQIYNYNRDDVSCLEFPDNVVKSICVDDILKKDPEKLSSYENMQNECSIAYFMQVFVEGSNCKNRIRRIEYDLPIDKIQSIIEYLTYISNVSKVLAIRIQQPISQYITTMPPVIVRSSYNFCAKTIHCKCFYIKDGKPTCKDHHYVHSMLKYDVDSVIAFLTNVVDNNIVMDKEDYNNLYLSIKTICYVTRHMAKEISFINYVTSNNSEMYHRNNPLDIKKTKIIAKKTSHQQNSRNSKIKRDLRTNISRNVVRNNIHKNKCEPIHDTIKSNRFAILSE